MAKAEYETTFSIRAMKQLGEPNPNGGGQWILDEKTHYEKRRFPGCNSRSEALKMARDYRPEFHAKYLGPHVTIKNLRKVESAQYSKAV